jgi:hypothetical protein
VFALDVVVFIVLGFRYIPVGSRFNVKVAFV